MLFQIEEVLSQAKPRIEILSLGTDTRQRVSWAKDGKIFSLRPKKDFNDISDFYFQAAEFLSKKIRLKPKVITFDPHPGFVCHEKSVVIKDRYFPGAKLCPVFHHIAHIAYFGLEAGFHKDFIGVAFDGTGFGQDGNVWGGEFFVYKNKRFQRVAYFEYQPLAGNDRAILEPWRMAFLILYKIYSHKLLKMKLGFLKDIPREKLKLVREMVDKNFNSPQTSSVGRLFDAVCAILNLRTIVTKEAEAAIALEKEASAFKEKAKSYPFQSKEKGELIIVDLVPMFGEIVDGLRHKEKASRIAYRFHLTIAQTVDRISEKLRKKYSINNVYLCGGVFMNDILTRETGSILVKNGFHAYFAKRPQTTDLGISEGQIAAYMMEKLCA